MATLVLTTVGGIVGGPIGAAVGAAIGQQVDQRLFAPKGRKGPRLGELTVQTSSYGSAIAKLFGTNRVAGTVIWATDLKESKKKVSNGKGQPKSTVYSYSASFAVLLSGRPISGVGRIWADGGLLRGSAGDLKTQTGFRLYTGSERQPVDPQIASAQGLSTTPAYRGMAYAVFEDFQLGEYGNRIPSLSFEVIADADPVALGTVAEELGGGSVTAAWPATLDGVAATGDSLRGLIESFAPLLPVQAREQGRTLHLAADPPAPTAIAPLHLGASGSQERCAPVERERRAAGLEPSAISVAHHEPARDYQQGVQRAANPGGEGRELRLELPASAPGSAVKALAVGAARRSFRARASAIIRLPWRSLGLAPGDLVTLPGDAQLWRIETLTLEAMVLVAQLRAHAPFALPAAVADPGAGVLQPDLLHGPTSFELLDLPPLDASPATMPRLAVAAAGASPGWRGAALLMSTNGGASWEEAGATAARATMGTALSALATAAPHIADQAASVEVELLAADMVLNDADEAALDSGANLAMLGHELIQFAAATPLGNRRYRLSHLLRGRRGTEWAIAGHAAGERFVLIEAQSLATLPLPVGTAALQVMAVSVGDPSPPVRTVTVTGEAIRPPAPVHLVAERQANGDTKLVWTRRSRQGWAWVDGADAPLAEEAERYRLSWSLNSGASRVVETDAPSLVYTAAERAADVAGGATAVTVSIVQLGTLGASRPAALALSLT